MKFTVAVVNWGGPRKKGEERYARNLFNLPVFFALTIECQEEHVLQVEAPRLEWEKASDALAVDIPAQGFDEAISCAGGRKFVQKWRASEIFYGLAVVGRCSRVKEYRYPEKFVVEWQGGHSKLMAVEVVWQQPVANSNNEFVIIGHLHNELTKKKIVP